MFRIIAYLVDFSNVNFFFVFSVSSPATPATMDVDSEPLTKSVTVTKERLSQFRNSVQSKFQAAHKQSLTVTEVMLFQFL